MNFTTPAYPDSLFMGDIPPVTHVSTALPLDVVWNEPFEHHKWLWHWAVWLHGGKIIDKWHFQLPTGEIIDAGEIERFSSELLRDQRGYGDYDLYTENPKRTLQTLLSVSERNDPFYRLTEYLGARFYNQGFEGNPGYWNITNRTDAEIVSDIMIVVLEWMDFMIAAAPAKLGVLAIDQATAVVEAQVEWIRKNWPKGIVPNIQFVNAVKEGLDSLADNLEYNRYFAWQGNPKERLEEMNRAIGKIALAPQSRWEAHETFTEDPTWLAEEAEHIATREERIPVLPEEEIPGIPESSAYVPPPTTEVEVGLTKEKILKYLPFVGIGIGVFRVFFS